MKIEKAPLSDRNYSTKNLRLKVFRMWAEGRSVDLKRSLGPRGQSRSNGGYSGAHQTIMADFG